MIDDKTRETSSPYLEISKILKEREKIARLSATAYRTSSKKIERKSNYVLVSTLVASMVLACIAILLPLCPMGNNLVITTILAFLALGFSIFSAADRLFGWNTKKADYDLGFRTWTRYQRESQWFRKNELEILSSAEVKAKADRFQSQYANYVSILPPNGLSEREFLDCKLELYKSIAISKMIDDDPFIDISEKLKEIK